MSEEKEFSGGVSSENLRTPNEQLLDLARTVERLKADNAILFTRIGGLDARIAALEIIQKIAPSGYRTKVTSAFDVPPKAELKDFTTRTPIEVDDGLNPETD
jgi:hypothetical protein